MTNDEVRKPVRAAPDEWASNIQTPPEYIYIEEGQSIEDTPALIAWKLLKDTTKYAYYMGVEGVFMVTDTFANLHAVGHAVYLNKHGVWTYNKRNRVALDHMDDCIKIGTADLTLKYDEALKRHETAVLELRTKMAERREQMEQQGGKPRRTKS